MTWRIFFRPNNAGLNFLIAHEPEPDDLGSKSSSFKIHMTLQCNLRMIYIGLET